MAKRRINVVQVTFFPGPGGVGLSLFSSHLNAMYGENLHKFFDPTVFYEDQEMRKVITLLSGGIIFTGQDKPFGVRTPSAKIYSRS